MDQWINDWIQGLIDGQMDVIEWMNEINEWMNDWRDGQLGDQWMNG